MSDRAIEFGSSWRSSIVEKFFPLIRQSVRRNWTFLFDNLLLLSDIQYPSSRNSSPIV